MVFERIFPIEIMKNFVIIKVNPHEQQIFFNCEGGHLEVFMDLKEYAAFKVTGTPYKEQEVETVSDKESDIQVGLSAASKLDSIAKKKMAEFIGKELGRFNKGSDSADLGGLK
jgi:hypothetical protein